MPKHISLSDIACSSRSVSVFGSRLEHASCVSDWVVRVVGFDPRSGTAQPNPARPGPALRAPGAHTPHAPPPPLPLSFGSPAHQPPSPSSTSLSPWCPRDWRRRSPEFGPRGEFPSPSLLLSLPLPPPSLPCAPPSLSPARGGARPRPSPAPAHGGARLRPGPVLAGAHPRSGLPVAALARPALAPWRRPPLPLPPPRGGAPRPRRGPPALAPARPRPPARGVPAPGVTRVAPFTP
jgi:hypothetical protein